MHLPPDDADEPPRTSKRAAAVLFLIGWLILPVLLAVFSVDSMPQPWEWIARVGVGVFVVVWVGAMVRAIVKR